MHKLGGSHDDFIYSKARHDVCISSVIHAKNQFTPVLTWTIM